MYVKLNIQIYIYFTFNIYLRGNIPGNQIDKGETLCTYLPPFPPNGTGWHRCVFLLYKHQQGPIKFSELYGPLPGTRYVLIWQILIRLIQESINIRLDFEF